MTGKQHKLCCYIQPLRTLTPTTGAGKHINQTVLGLNALEDVDCHLLCSSEWCKDGALPSNSPLRSISTHTFPMRERRAEWMWKIAASPCIDRWSGNADWIYSPSEALLPSKSTPVAITVFDIHPLDPLYPIESQWERRVQRLRWSIWLPRAIERCDIVFTISEFSKSRMVELLRVDPDKIKVVGCGVERTFFQESSKTSVPNSKNLSSPFTVVVGGLSFRKAGDKVLEVAKHLERMGSALTIVVVGSNDGKYEKMAETHKNVTLLGKVSDEELPAIVRSASSLLMLSRYEGFGIPPVEAMAAGVPVVVSRTASLPEVVGNAGITVELNDTESAAEQLQLLCINDQIKQTMIAKGLERSQNFTWNTVVNKIYCHLFGKPIDEE